nr:cytochrome c oxidase subunit III [Acharax sp. NY-2022]
MRGPYHLVDYSPWPFTASAGILLMAVGSVYWFQGGNMYLLITGFFLLIITVIQWWRDVIRESTFQGSHTNKVANGLRWGMLLFIISEVMFFFAFFWAYFHSSLAPVGELGACWPPVGIQTLSPFQLPLLNTAILLGSGITVTWAHHSLMENDHNNTMYGLLSTCLLGIYFTFLQLGEYMEVSFTSSDGIYGSTFFVATGFHGLHVVIGTIFLIICLQRVWFYQFSSGHYFGFEAAAWYWHFVDVVWLFLYVSIYWWGV